jgi:hypothetical protein
VLEGGPGPVSRKRTGGMTSENRSQGSSENSTSRRLMNKGKRKGRSDEPRPLSLGLALYPELAAMQSPKLEY